MDEVKSPARPATSYESDFHAWANEQARRLRRARPQAIDWENIAEEVESLGRSDKRAIGSDLKIILEHLIKWRFQSDERTARSSDSIEEHRDRILRILEDSPSLAAIPGEVIEREYERACRRALRETKLSATRIPKRCPFTVEQALDPDFLPEAETR